MMINDTLPIHKVAYRFRITVTLNNCHFFCTYFWPLWHSVYISSTLITCIFHSKIMTLSTLLWLYPTVIFLS